MAEQQHATQIPFRDEAQFQEQLIRYAKLCGWAVMHIGDSRKEVRRGNARYLIPDPLVSGWPDLTLVHAKRRLFLVRELKTNHGKVTVEQQAWLDALAAAGVDAAVWRPRDLPAIERLLAGSSTTKAR